ncbi:helix-turn-helix domain-containing protein [Lactiplantibacillus pentosus]|uniref:helix-turn-helix domain-containing protein n=1 Tax=Lactiplantibacillus pentosus TaxID=1589 RepID=UPI00234B1C91|nr:helix-turn-helix transcriptional regulator [Lactiplantibacillus pentosus]MDC6398623.1 helix-turn-helix transcriptional regulator [Lactiplantibacillus pentosus]
MSNSEGFVESLFSGQSSRIKQARKDAKLTQTELADLYNQFLAKHDTDVKPVSYATISRWENGETSPKFETLTILANVLNVDESYLIGAQKEPKSSRTTSIELIEGSNNLSDLKFALADIVADLYDTIYTQSDEIEYLQSQINIINNPGSGEDYD